MSELRKCPFCGGEAELFSDDGTHDKVCCNSPKCSVKPCTDGYSVTSMAIRAWNTRPNDWLQSQVIVIDEGGEPRVGDVLLWAEMNDVRFAKFEVEYAKEFIILARICPKDNVLKPVVVRKKTSEGI